MHDTVSTSMRPDGLDMGTVTLTYTGGSVDLRKRVAPDGGVLHETFGKGFHHFATPPVNIPFVANGVCAFTVSGSEAYTAGTFEITAPSSLLSITGHANGDTVSATSDLTVTWTGGSGPDSVLIRVVPHLRPEEAEHREGRDSLGCIGDHEGATTAVVLRNGDRLVLLVR